MSVNTKMTAIANAIREKTGGTDLLTLDGMAESIPQVFQAGKNAEYDMFWDSIQQNGNRQDYWGTFAFWADEIFKPKYPIKTNSANYLFYHCGAANIPEITITGSTLINTFENSRGQVIEKVKLLANGSQSFTSTFLGMKQLREIRFEGVIGNNISFKDSTLLSAESMASIVEALSASASGKTLTLSQTAVNNADWTTTAYADWAALIATKTNWTFSLV